MDKLRKSPKRSPLPFRKRFWGGGSERSGSGPSPYSLRPYSQPSSPSSKVVSRHLSRSDAALHLKKRQRRKDSDGGSVELDSEMGGGGELVTTPTETGDGGNELREGIQSTNVNPPYYSRAPSSSSSPHPPSPSLLARATGYVALLKSRLGKNRNDSAPHHPSTTSQHYPHHPSLSSCCHRQEPESIEGLTVITSPPTGDKERTTSGRYNQISNSSPETLPPPPPTTKPEEGEGATNMPKFPFYTMTVNLQRGKNLVARDTCGSSDPYVKVKIGDRVLYKSRTINRDLNPVWDETFVLPINDLNQTILFKVFDYDWGFQDDFMGMSSLDPQTLLPNRQTELSLILTETNTPGTEYMGELHLSVTLVPRTIEEKEIWITGSGADGGKVGEQKRLKSQVWSSVLTILLIEAKHISSSTTSEESYIMDAFVKFRLGNQKYKSRTIQRSSSPKWLEQFDFYLYEGQPQILEIQVFDESFSRDYIGRVALDIGLFEKEKTHGKELPLQEGGGYLSLLLTISGTAGGLDSNTSDLINRIPSPQEIGALRQRYSLFRSLNSLKDVGTLTVKVFEAQGLAALDIGGKSDPFCVLELVNERLQTQTEYRTLCPVWNKVFHFGVKDVTSVLEITVYDEDKNHKQEFLGKLLIPLYRIRSGEKRWHVLKDSKMLREAQGNHPKILLQFHLQWNPIRAGIRVLDPPEQKFLVPDQRLRRETFLLNIDRLKKIGVAVYDVIQYIESCIEWEYPLRSLIALVTYQLVVYTFQPYMAPLFVMLLMLKQWVLSSLTGKPGEVEEEEEVELLVPDEDEEKEEEDKKMSLRQKLQAVQDGTQTVQNALGAIASLCESTRNTFRMAVPFISCLVVLGLMFATVLLYYVPLRYLAMAYGFHKFFRPILRPHAVPTNELYNILLRVPDNLQMTYYRPLRPSPSPKPSTSCSERTRSPQGSGASTVTNNRGGKEGKKKHKFW